MKVESLACPNATNPDYYMVRCMTKNRAAARVLFRVLYFLLNRHSQ